MEHIFWAAFSNNERYTEIDRLKHVINKYGDIVDVKFFSDISLNMTIEIEEFKINDLYNNLSGLIEIDRFTFLNSKAHRERTIYLNITFSKGTGNLAIAVPAVPG